VVSLSLFFGHHYLWAGFTTGLLFLTRGEGALVLMLLMAIGTACDWIERKSFDIRMLRPACCLGLCFVVPFLIWAVYAQFTFGAFLPNTLAAKRAQAMTHIWPLFRIELMRSWLPDRRAGETLFTH
jgi:hypothetical protein